MQWKKDLINENNNIKKELGEKLIDLERQTSRVEFLTQISKKSYRCIRNLCQIVESAQLVLAQELSFDYDLKLERIDLLWVFTKI